MMDYKIEALSNENIDHLAVLYKGVFGNNVSAEFVRRKFDTKYLIHNYFGHLAYFNEQPVAFHGAIPVLMKWKDKTELAAQYGDAMTLKKHTGKGLFTKLGKLTDQQLIKENIKFVWGFPNQNSEYGYLNKLDWKSEESMQGFKLTASKIPVEKLINKNNFTAKLLQNYIKKVFKKYRINAVLKGSVYHKKDVVSTCRNRDFYNYRSFSDNFVIKLENVLFWIKIKNGLLVGDVETNSEQDFFEALEMLKKIARKIGIREIIFQTSPDTQIEELMSQTNAQKFNSWVVGYKNFSSNFPLEKLKFTFGDLDTF